MRRPSLILPLLTLALFVSAGSASAAQCPEGLVCQDVTVPLDRTGEVPGTIDLPVVAEPGNGPLLLFLGGGPGQGMADQATGVINYLGPLAPGRRLAVLDQRGTGRVALRCPSIQFAALSDLTVPKPGSIEACGRKLGQTRGLYTTTATVDDLDAVREALGAEKMAIWGVSYGTYVAERYARAYPDQTSGLLLDSVVTQKNVEPFFTAGMKRSRVTLRQLCGMGVCRGLGDPVTNLSRLVRRSNNRWITGRVSPEPGKPRAKVRLNGAALYDMLVGLSSFDPPGFARFPKAVHQALKGSPAPLLRLALQTRQAGATSSYESLSWGAHTAALCGDVNTWPWGGADAPLAGRKAKVLAAARRIPARKFLPFDRQTGMGNGALVTCQRWQQTAVEPPPEPGPLPAVPTLVVAGGWDLSTPLVEARREARRSPTAKLFVIPRAGHSSAGIVQCSRPAIRRFFTGKPPGTPCTGHKPDLG